MSEEKMVPRKPTPPKRPNVLVENFSRIPPFQLKVGSSARRIKNTTITPKPPKR